MSGRVDVDHGFVVAMGAFVFVSDAMTVGGAKSAIYPLSFDESLELLDAVVKGLLLGGGKFGASAAAVVSYSSQGKGGFKLR